MKKPVSFVLSLALAGAVCMFNGFADNCAAESVGVEDPVFNHTIERIGGVYSTGTIEHQLTDELTVKCDILEDNTLHLTSFTGSVNGELVIPSEIEGYSVSEIGYMAFTNCNGMTSVTIPDSVNKINYCAFFECAELETVILPDSISVIEAGTFKKCTSLTSVNIPESVTEIEFDAFAQCTALTEINIPDSVKLIGSGAFTDTGWYNNLPDGMLFMGNILCDYKGTASENSSIVIPENIKSISSESFACQPGITSVTFNKNIDRIIPHTFIYSTGLTSVTIPGNVITVMYGAFEECTNLKTVTLENGVKNIEIYAFSGCSELSRIVIPESVHYIADDAFKDCSENLTICGYRDSAAEEYARLNGIKFSPLDSEENPVTTASAAATAASVSSNNSTPKTGDGGIPCIAAAGTAAALTAISFRKKKR